MLILQSNLPENKSIAFALKQIYSINHTSAQAICCKIGVNPNNTLKELNRSQSDTLIQTCSDLILTNAYRHKVESMKRLITINSYRGQRILLALPCRGQRTRTNASTVKRQLGKLRSRLKTNT
jgi:small subunit ribosomal protein S13